VRQDEGTRSGLAIFEDVQMVFVEVRVSLLDLIEQHYRHLQMLGVMLVEVLLQVGIALVLLALVFVLEPT